MSGAGLGYFRGEKWKNKAKIYNSGGSCSVSLFRIFSIRVGICLGPKENPITICKINYSSQIISDLTSNNFFRDLVRELETYSIFTRPRAKLLANDLRVPKKKNRHKKFFQIMTKYLNTYTVGLALTTHNVNLN